MSYDIVAPALPRDLRPDLQAVLEEFGMELTSAGWPLAGVPDSRHWHIRRSERRGTLEVTFQPEAAKLWVSVHANRDGGWAVQACPKFARALAARLGGRARKRPSPRARR